MWAAHVPDPCREWFDATETNRRMCVTAADVRTYEGTASREACTQVYIKRRTNKHHASQRLCRQTTEVLGRDDGGRARIEPRKKRKPGLSTGEDANVEMTGQYSTAHPRTQRCRRVSQMERQGASRPVEASRGINRSG